MVKVRHRFVSETRKHLVEARQRGVSILMRIDSRRDAPAIETLRLRVFAACRELPLRKRWRGRPVRPSDRSEILQITVRRHVSRGGNDVRIIEAPLVIDLQLSKDGGWEGQFGAVPQGFEQAGRLADALEVGAHRLVEVGEALRHEVGQACVLEVAPDLFDRVEVRGVGGQAFEV